MKTRTDLLRESLQVLAAPAVAQLQYLAALGVPGLVDELALEFDDIGAAARDMLEQGELRPSQYEAVGRVDRRLAEMSDSRQEALWTPKALTESSEWAELRQLASAALSTLNKQTA